MNEYNLEWQSQRDANQKKWMLGNAHAIEFLRTIGFIAEIWDDLVDRDKPVSNDKINEAFIASLFMLPSNPFFALHRALLLPVMLVAMQGHIDEQRLSQDQTTEAKEAAHRARYLMTELYTICALIVGGYEHLQAVSADMRKFFAYERRD